MDASHIFANPGRTKLALVSRGVALPEGLSRPSRWLSQVNAVETVVDIMLPSGHFATVPVGQPFTQGSPIVLHEDDGKAWLVCDNERLDVELIKAPKYYHQSTRAGARMGSFSSLHDRLLMLNPLLGCGFFARENQACHYCQYDSLLNEAVPPLRDPLELVEVVRAALSERDIDTVYLYNAYAPGDDAGLARLVPVLALLRRHLGHRQIALETVAPHDVSVINELYAAGLDIFICNMELNDVDAFARICPGKEAHGGQVAIRAALHRAVDVFRQGAVVSHLIPGLEPLESTKAGMEALVNHGVVPLLVPFRPLPGTALEHQQAPDLADIEQALLHLYGLLASSGLPTHRLRDMGRVMTPMEGRVLSGERGALRDHLDGLVTTSAGRWIGGWMDKFQRRLRVQHVDSGSKKS